jgi:hypothetical protein
VFAQIAGVIEAAGLQIGAGRPDFGKGCLGQDLGGNVVDRAIGDFMDEADVLVFAGHDTRDDLPPRDFWIDDGLATAPSVVDHHDEILQGGAPIVPVRTQRQYF